MTAIVDVPLREFLHDPAPYSPKEGAGPVLVVCKLGNDSQIAAKALREVANSGTTGAPVIKDLIGGLRAWSRDVDPAFPVY
jgi:adenylyltransferase/sulfurtransferase